MHSVSKIQFETKLIAKLKKRECFELVDVLFMKSEIHIYVLQKKKQTYLTVEILAVHQEVNSRKVLFSSCRTNKNKQMLSIGWTKSQVVKG